MLERILFEEPGYKIVDTMDKEIGCGLSSTSKKARLLIGTAR